MAVDQPALAVSDLRKEYPIRGGGGKSLVAVDRVSFEVARGGALAVVGESGSGKTTVARMIVGLERPTSGEVRFAGEPFDASRGGRAARRAHARRVQLVFQDPYSSLDPRQSIGSMLTEVLEFHFRLGADECDGRLHSLADDVGLEVGLLRARPGQLSGGQRQRAAIARALAAGPDVLVLDEAVAALDVSIQAQILNLLADLRERTNVTYLFISHDLAVVRQITDEVIVMRSGHVVEAGQTAAVLDDPQDAYTRRLRDSIPAPGWDPAQLV